MAGSFVFALASLSAALPAIKDAGLKAFATSAAHNARAGLKSGAGEGVYERSDGAGNPPVRYALKVSHLGAKYRIELTHLGPCPATRPSKLVLIYDGEALAYREVKAVMHPHGEESRLYPAAGDRPWVGNYIGSAPRFNPTCLQAAVFDLPALLRTEPDQPNTVYNRGDMKFAAGTDGIVASVRPPRHPDYRIGVQFPKAAGYNVSAFTSEAEKTGYRQEAVARWERAAGVWYVREVESAYDRPGVGREYQRLTYTAYTPNAAVDPALFRLPALELVRGARVLYVNLRSQATDAYVNDPTPGEWGDTLLDGLRRLPATWSRRVVAPAPREVPANRPATDMSRGH